MLRNSQVNTLDRFEVYISNRIKQYSLIKDGFRYKDIMMMTPKEMTEFLMISDSVNSIAMEKQQEKEMEQRNSMSKVY